MKFFSTRFMKKLLLLLAGFIALVIFWFSVTSRIARSHVFAEVALVANKMRESSNGIVPSFISHWRPEDPCLLLVVVVSPPGRFDQRMTIRQTWGTVDQRKDTEVVFLLNISDDERVADESDLYGDIVQRKYSDSDAVSTALSIVHWVSEYRPQSRFVLKIDDDCFLNPFNLFKWLVNTTVDVALFGHGPVDGACPVAIGQPSYVMTGKAIAMLNPSGSVWTTEKLLPRVCDQMAKIPVFNQSDLNVVIKSSICEGETSLTMTRVSTNSMRMLWWFVNDEKLRGPSNVCLKSALFDADV